MQNILKWSLTKVIRDTHIGSVPSSSDEFVNRNKENRYMLMFCRERNAQLTSKHITVQM